MSIEHGGKFLVVNVIWLYLVLMAVEHSENIIAELQGDSVFYKNKTLYSYTLTHDISRSSSESAKNRTVLL